MSEPTHCGELSDRLEVFCCRSCHEDLDDFGDQMIDGELYGLPFDICSTVAVALDERRAEPGEERRNPKPPHDVPPDPSGESVRPPSRPG